MESYFRQDVKSNIFLFTWFIFSKPIAQELASFCFPNGIDTSKVLKRHGVMDVSEQIFASLDRLEGPERYAYSIY